ncbi:hypothetical protein HU200_047995 [Digitaria exilis]|uniref:Uncharacterized protein n=1 Tax=Digitaria exilis TaxID=1010633 RepID=A0A835EDF8_9POAL|nr:hypothetical protein HU200_047995 [Digitaria exilis]
MRENLDIFDWELTADARHKIGTLPEFRGTYDFFVHDSGPYKTVEEFWDNEITDAQPNQSVTALGLDPNPSN